MAKEVHLLNYWMPLLRKLKEFKEIAKTEEPELRYILAAIDRTLANFFIESADEYGIKRYEDMMGIVPEETDTLDTRRFRVLTKWNNYVPYTEPELYRRLVSICGSEDAFELEEHYKEYWLRVTTHLGVAGAFDMVANTLDDMLPCNLVLELANIMEAKPFSTLYMGGVCCTALGYCITHDIEAEAEIAAPMRVGVGLARAGTHIVTHDLDSKVATVSPLSEAVANATAMLSMVTHDVSLQDKSEAALSVGTGTGSANVRIITHDINSKVSNTGNTSVAGSVSGAMRVTIN